MGNCIRSAFYSGVTSLKVNSEPSSASPSPIAGPPPSSPPSSPEQPPLPDITSQTLKLFNYHTLQASTMNFHPARLLGKGFLGNVFKAWIDPITNQPVRPRHGVAIAVKKWDSTQNRNHREWLLQVSRASELSHPNIAKVLGYSIQGENRLLVCRYMPRGSLAGVLFNARKETLSWETRVRIALNIAYALKYLHESEPQVIYGDLKSSNILLDYDYNARVSGFGFVKPGDVPNQVGRVPEYVLLEYTAPEYLETGVLRPECDIYSYGVLLLELLSGRPTIDLTKSGDESDLVAWVQPLSRDTRRLARFMDPRLLANYYTKGAYLAIMLGLQCTGEERLRPSPDHIIEVIKKLGEEELHDAQYPFVYHA